MRPVSHLRSCHSPEPAFYQLGFDEAAVGDITLPAISGRSEISAMQVAQCMVTSRSNTFD